MARTSGQTPAGSLEPDADFLAAYYAHVAAEDLHNYDPETLRARAAHHLELASRRPPGEAVVGILNELDTSVVAVVADDLPYLVQSVAAELTREDTPIHQLVHPTFLVHRDPLPMHCWTSAPGRCVRDWSPSPPLLPTERQRSGSAWKSGGWPTPRQPGYSRNGCGASWPTCGQ